MNGTPQAVPGQWKPLGFFRPTRFLKGRGGFYELAGVFALEDGSYGLAHGTMNFHGDADEAYCRCAAGLAFEREEYWRACLLPERYSTLSAAMEQLAILIGERAALDGAAFPHSLGEEE